MTERVLPASVRLALERQDSGDFHPVLVELAHESLVAPIRAANDVVGYRVAGRLYYGIPFELSLVTDADSPPRATLTIQNVDRRIGEGVRQITSPMRVRIGIYAESDFTDAAAEADEDGSTIKVRNPIGTPLPFYEARFLRLRNISGSTSQVEGDLVGWDLAAEPWPRIRTTKNLLPGLFK